MYDGAAAENPHVLASPPQFFESCTPVWVVSGARSVLVIKVVSTALASVDVEVALGGKSGPDLDGGAPHGLAPGAPMAPGMSLPNGPTVLGVTMVLVIGCTPQSVQVSTAVVNP